MNHATIARRLAALEADLGASLFEKTPSGYVLKATGRGTLPDAEAMEDAATALARWAEAGDVIAGPVRVSWITAHVENLLAPGLSALT